MVRNHKTHQISKQAIRQLPSRRTKNHDKIKQAERQYRQKMILLKQKNRQSAQRSRDNKKKYIEGLEYRIQQLQLQNLQLKNLIKNCKCSKIPQEDVSNPSTGEEQSQEKAMIQDDEIYERVSIKSYTSCSNFLMLAIIVIFCIFGYLDMHNQKIKEPTGLYSVQNLESAMAKYTFSQCLIVFEPNKKKVMSPQQILKNSVSYKMEKFKAKQRLPQNQNMIYSKKKCEDLQYKSIQKMIHQKMIKNLTKKLSKR